MCGFFAGVFHPEAAPTDAQIETALQSISHRGPDGRHWMRRILKDGRVAVAGHVRLSLVGLDDGRQPFESEASLVVVNGEFYDWTAERDRLSRQGFVFKTRSDSEIAHAAFDLWGPGLWLDGLDGEWSMAAIDLRDGRIHAACDHFGTKPLRHWTSKDGRSYAVASEAKALFALGVPAKLDTSSLRFALGLQYLPSGRTLFEDVGMVPPGCRISMDGGTVEPWPWADTFFESEAANNEDPAPSEAIALLRASVRRRIPTETSFATHLSGGLDSALILALATEAAGPGIDAFTADFDFGPNEVDQAAVTAAHLGANLIPVRMDAKSMIEAMDLAPYHSEGLSINAHAAAKIAIARAVRDRGHKSVLTGEGADEAFWGYEHLRMDAGMAMHEDASVGTLGVHRPEREAEGLESLKASFGGVLPGFVATKAAAAMSMSPAFGDRLKEQPFDGADMYEALPWDWKAAANSSHMLPAQVSRGLWNVHGLSGYILRGLDDAMGMSSGVESRLAFMDLPLQRFAARSRPATHFGTDGMEKRLLREGSVGLIPESVRTRRKAPFMGPALSQTREGGVWARERLLDGQLAGSGLFTASGLEALLDQKDRPVKDAHVLTLASLSNLMDAFGLD